MNPTRDSGNEQDGVRRLAYDKPRLVPLGSIAGLTLGSTQTAMPESGGSGNSQV